MLGSVVYLDERSDSDPNLANPILELHPEHDGNLLHECVKRNFLIVVSYL